VKILAEHGRVSPSLRALQPPRHLCLHLLAQSTVEATSSWPPSTLNPSAIPFSASSTPSRTSLEDLPEWMLFSPSSFERWWPASGRLASVSPTPSYGEVAHGKGKVSMVEPGSSNPWAPAPAQGQEPNGFMADGRRAHPGCTGPEQPHCPSSHEGWQVVHKCKQ
jgi:hypothetical protein